MHFFLSKSNIGLIYNFLVEVGIIASFYVAKNFWNLFIINGIYRKFRVMWKHILYTPISWNSCYISKTIEKNNMNKNVDLKLIIVG